MKKHFDIYLIHHSHTDIGYTHEQEKVVCAQIDYIKDVIKTIDNDPSFKWNCETYFCVERFLKESTPEQKEKFIKYVKSGNICLSASYLNFTDLADSTLLDEKTKEMAAFWQENGVKISSAMNADINGISQGSLAAFLNSEINFLYTNVHTHHGMYPLYQNQTPWFWQLGSKKLLVWNAEHYNLGNAIGIVKDPRTNGMIEKYFKTPQDKEFFAQIKANLDEYIDHCIDYGYEYDFIPMSISGCFSDNAHPNGEISKTIKVFNEKYGEDITLHMVTLDELYQQIKDKTANAPTFTGDLTDWWAHGVASNPYSLKHFRQARELYFLSKRLDRENTLSDKELMQTISDNLLLFAEHTWGHAASITHPYDTTVLNLDMRKTSYAAIAHAAATENLFKIKKALGNEKIRFSDSGTIKIINTVGEKTTAPTAFWADSQNFCEFELTNAKTNEAALSQTVKGPIGTQIVLLDSFEAYEEKTYKYKKKSQQLTPNSRAAYMGTDLVRDIINDYDSQSHKLPYFLENDFFKISYEAGKGITSFYNKAAKKEMLKSGDEKFFTPIFEKTEILTNTRDERLSLGRNIRGLHAKKYIGELSNILVKENGEVFKEVELVFSLEGTYFCSVEIKMYNALPTIDFKLKIAKNYSENIESIFLPLALDLEKETYVDKGGIAFKPGEQQVEGTCMEYYLIDTGVVYKGDAMNVEINLYDTPLVYMGELKSHQIKLCDNKKENNQRSLYSWVMNNVWETNFKMGLSGAGEYCYSLSLAPTQAAEKSFDKMKTNFEKTTALLLD